MIADQTNVIQISNVSPAVSRDQIKTLFSFIGEVEEIKLYPEQEAIEVPTRVSYVKYKDKENVGVSLHLTNTVLVDKALIVVPVPEGKIPDELTALGVTPSSSDSSSMYQGLSQYPVLPANTELSKVEEIRRTVYVSNIDCTVTPEVLMQFFTQAGEIKYMRMAGDETASLKHAYIEYSDQNSVLKALSMNGSDLVGFQVKVVPSTNAIIKPPVLPGITASSKEIEEALKKVSEAESLISAAIDPLTNGSKRSRSRSRRSRSRRSRSRRSRSRGSRSRRSRERHRSRSTHRSRSRRSRSGHRSRSKRSRHRSRSKDRKSSRDKRRRSKSSTSKSHSRRRSRSGEVKKSKEVREGWSPGEETKKSSKKKSRSRSKSKKSKKSKRSESSRENKGRSDSGEE